MNPITNAKNLNKLNEKELNLGLTGSSTSWHSLYDESAWIFVGGLAYDITEGDVITVFSQYGEIVNINLVRDKKTGKSKGYCFICYEDQRSTILAVDNFNGIKLLNRIIRVDHVQDYRMPKEFGDEDELTQKVRSEGCGPGVLLGDRMKAERSPDKTAKQIEVKKEEFSDDDDDGRRIENKRVERKNMEEHHKTNITPVVVKKEPNDTGYETYNRREEAESRDRNQCNREEQHEEQRSRKQSVKYQEKRFYKPEAMDSSNEESEKCSRSKTSETRGKEKRNQNHRTEEKLEKRHHVSQRERSSYREQSTDSSETKYRQRERDKRARYTSSKHSDSDRQVVSHRNDVSQEKQSHGRHDYHSDEPQRQSKRERSSDRHRHNYSSSSDEEEQRKSRRN